jgi:nitrite reductase (NO-forming)
VENNTLTRAVGRRRFLAMTGGLAAVGALSAAGACDAGSGLVSYDQGTRQAEVAGAATGPTATPAAATPQASGSRPKASGKLATVYDASMPVIDNNPDRTLVLQTAHKQLEVAAGVMMNAWTFDGVVPGNVAHIRQGDTVHFTLRNSAQMGHSIDFHAAQTPWDVNYQMVMPGKDFSFDWKANYPGTFMYHCGTQPVLQHLANGMYGAIVVDPAQPFEPAREYVLVQSEFYLKQAADGTSWDTDLDRAKAVQPDFVVFNGAANQYQQTPLKAAPNELIRLHVVNAGPTLFSAFHVIGAIFDKVYPDGNPQNVLHGVQTWTIPPGGGATFELRIPDAGQYPFVTHAFAYTGLGAVGLIEVA